MNTEKHKSDFSHSPEETEVKRCVLLLHNDEINTFDYVIDCLTNICNHDPIQAEQCATITHHKGKCDIKTGVFSALKPMKDSLIERGLSATIEN
jgi:ATP-dependent Clp protease adaptor protein ClpS